MLSLSFLGKGGDRHPFPLPFPFYLEEMRRKGEPHFSALFMRPLKRKRAKFSLGPLPF